MNDTNQEAWEDRLTALKEDLEKQTRDSLELVLAHCAQPYENGKARFDLKSNLLRRVSTLERSRIGSSLAANAKSRRDGSRTFNDSSMTHDESLLFSSLIHSIHPYLLSFRNSKTSDSMEMDDDDNIQVRQKELDKRYHRTVIINDDPVLMQTTLFREEVLELTFELGYECLRPRIPTAVQRFYMTTAAEVEAEEATRRWDENVILESLVDAKSLSTLLQKVAVDASSLPPIPEDLRYCSLLVCVCQCIAQRLHCIGLMEVGLLTLSLGDTAQALDDYQWLEDHIPKYLAQSRRERRKLSTSEDNNSTPLTSLFPKVIVALRHEMKLMRTRLLGKTRRLFYDAIQIDNGRLGVQSSLTGYLRSEDRVIEHSVTLQTLWRTTWALGALDDLLLPLLKQVWQRIIIPLWRERPRAPGPNIQTRLGRREFVLDCATRSDGESEGVRINVALIGLKPRNSAGGLLESTNQSNGISGVSGSASFSSRGNSTSNGVSSQTIESLGAARLSLPDLFDYLGQAFAFLHAEVFCADEELCEMVGLALQDAPFRLADRFVEAVNEHLPSAESELNMFRSTLSESARELEWRLERLFCFSTGSRDTPVHRLTVRSTSLNAESAISNGEITAADLSPVRFLSAHLDHLGVVFSATKRQDILAHARALLRSDYHNTMIGTGDAREDDLSSAGDVGDLRGLLDQACNYSTQRLPFDACQVSLTAARLAKFLHDVIRQARSAAQFAHNQRQYGTSSASISKTATGVTSEYLGLANILFHSARECLELFLSIVRGKLDGSATGEVVQLRMAAVFFNDCQYLAHNGVLLTHVHAKELASVNKETDATLDGSAAFIDFLPRLRREGDVVLSTHVEKQRGLLLELVDAMNLQICGSHNRDEATNKETTADALVIHMELIRQQWSGVLQEPVYRRLISQLVDDVFTPVVQSVFHRLAGKNDNQEVICASTLSDLTRVLLVLQPIGRLLREEGEQDDTSAQVSPSWGRFVALLALLTSSLSSVYEELLLAVRRSDTTFRRFHAFSVSELATLVTALYDDTPRRAYLLSTFES